MEAYRYSVPRQGIIKSIWLVMLLTGLLVNFGAYARNADSNKLVIHTSNTASGYGLMQLLIENFIKKNPSVEIQLVEAGGLEVLEKGRQGQSDLIITHLPASEKLFINEDYGIARTLIMYNDFIILGPVKDRVGLTGERSLQNVLKKLAEAEVNFVVPSKRSGTYKKMEELWQMTGIEPDWIGYESLTESSENTLIVAAEFGYYAITDLGTYISFQDRIKGKLVPIFRDHIALRNYYSAIVVNNKKIKEANTILAQSFVDYLVSDEGQKNISEFSVKAFGASVYVPAAHLDEGLKKEKMQHKLQNRLRTIQIMVVLIAVLIVMIVVAFMMYMKARAHENKRRLSEERFQLAAEGSSDGIWDWMIAEDSAYFSQRMNSVLEIDSDNMSISDPVKILRNCIHRLDEKSVVKKLTDYLENERDGHFETEFRIKNTNKDKWVLMRGKALRDENGTAIRMSGSITDITESVEQKAEIEYQALHDNLTGLPNRTLLLDRLSQMVRSVERGLQSFAVIMMDLNHFKEINDTLGHPVGDEVLKEVAYRLNNVLRKSDTIARLGGDEFAILLPGASSMYARHVAKKILLVLKRVIELDMQNMYISASLGISIFPQHGDDPHTLIRHADVAMYVAKREVAGCVVYDESQDNDSARQLKLEKDLVDAIKNNNLELYFQPKIDMREKTICGVEALVRWTHGDFGVISANEVVLIAESKGHINLLTRWVLEQTIKQLAEWHKENIQLVVAVNLSAMNLKNTDLVVTMKKLLDEYKVDPTMLEVEITESAMMSNMEHVAELLGNIDNMGIRISIDDFGTGFSSLAYLKKLPVDYIKIDRTFVLGMINDVNDESIVKSTIDLAHNLGIGVIAEGVEDKNILNKLVELGCEITQGYYFSEPLNKTMLIKWINTSPWGFAISEGRNKKPSNETNFTLH